ncbi:MAG: hypothetical protein V4489_08940 [Chlamydiota bacterium]
MGSLTPEMAPSKKEDPSTSPEASKEKTQITSTGSVSHQEPTKDSGGRKNTPSPSSGVKRDASTLGAGEQNTKVSRKATERHEESKAAAEQQVGQKRKREKDDDIFNEKQDIKKMD